MWLHVTQKVRVFHHRSAQSLQYLTEQTPASAKEVLEKRLRIERLSPEMPLRDVLNYLKSLLI